MAEDFSCLIHAGHDVDSACADCGVSMCSMCAVPYGADLICAECLEGRLKRQIRTSAWRGLVALASGLVGVAAVTAPYTFLADPAVSRLFGSDTSLFSLVSMASGATAVAIGMVAQDFEGIGKRAGAVGAGLGVLVLLAIVALNVASVALQ